MDYLAKWMFMTLKEWRRILILQLFQVSVAIANLIITQKHCSGDDCRIKLFDILGIIPKVVRTFAYHYTISSSDPFVEG